MWSHAQQLFSENTELVNYLFPFPNQHWSKNKKWPYRVSREMYGYMESVGNVSPYQPQEPIAC